MNASRPGALLLSLTLTLAGADAAAATGPTVATRVASDAAVVDAPADVVLPEPEVELPELPYDKARLPRVLELDAMIVDAARLAAAEERIRELYDGLRHVSSTSFNGTVEERIKGVLTVVDGVLAFDRAGRPLAEAARARFVEVHGDDDAFGRAYRELYSRAEEELHDLVEDGPTRRATSAAMGNTYKYAAGSRVGSLDSLLEEAEALRRRVIDRVVQSAETDMMVADYKKGRALVDLLQATRNTLAVVRVLDPESERIATVLAAVDEKQAARMEDVAAARRETRFPEAATGAPADADALVASITARLEAAGREVEACVVASEWIAVHSVLGIHMYSQIDFHVATPSTVAEEAEAGVLDILYVTGKTSGPALEVPFATHSAGAVGQMLRENL